jgi:glucans biosynthesis protein
MRLSYSKEAGAGARSHGERSSLRIPSVWWSIGAGCALVLATKEEVHDNIATFWRPKNPLQAKGEHNYTYRLHWGPDSPKEHSLARFTRVKGEPIELRAFLAEGDKSLSEVWVYRWAP